MKKRLSAIIGIPSLTLIVLLVYHVQAWAQQKTEKLLASINNLPPSERQQRLVEGAKKERALMTYTVFTLRDYQELIGHFNKKYPFIEVKFLRKGGGKLLDITVNEMRTGNYLVDVFSVGSTITRPLIDAGAIGRYLSPERAGFDEGYKDKDSYWTSFFAYHWVFGYNTNLVPKKKLPQTYFDLLDPYWKGKLALDLEPHTWMGGMIKAFGKERAIELFKGLARQGLHLRKGRTLRAQLMAAGEFPASIEQTESKLVQMKRAGAPLDYLYLENTPITLSPVALAKFAPHPHAAALFIDFLLSGEGQNAIADLWYAPTRKGFKPKDTELAGRVAKAKLVILNTDWFAPRQKEIFDLSNEIFTPGRR